MMSEGTIEVKPGAWIHLPIGCKVVPDDLLNEALTALEEIVDAVMDIGEPTQDSIMRACQILRKHGRRI